MTPRTLVTDALASASRTGVTVVRGVLVIPIIIGALGTDSYGIWASTHSVVGIVSGIGSLRLSDGLVRYLPTESNEDQLFVDFLCLGAAAVIAVSGCFLGLTFVVDVFPGVTDNTDFRIAVASVMVAFSLYELSSGYLRARGEIKRYELINTVRTGIEAVVLIVVFSAGYDLVIGFHALTGVSLLLIAVILLLEFPSSAGLPRVSRFREYVRFSAPLVPMTISNRLVANADRYIVLLLLSPTAAGVYAVAASVARFIENLIQSVNPTLYPTLVDAWEREEWAKITELYETVVRWAIILFFPAVSGLFVVGDTILRLLSNAEVAQSGRSLLPVLGFAFLASAVVGLVQISLNVAEMTDQNGRVSIGVAVVNLVLNVTLVGFFGLYGPAIATVVTYLLALRYLLGILPEQVAFDLPWLTIVRAGIATAVMTGVLFALPVSFSAYVELIAVPATGVVIYALAIVLVGEVSTDDVQFFRHHLG